MHLPKKGGTHQTRDGSRVAEHNEPYAAWIAGKPHSTHVILWSGADLAAAILSRRKRFGQPEFLHPSDWVFQETDACSAAKHGGVSWNALLHNVTNW
jgi:hypothetical protein